MCDLVTAQAKESCGEEHVKITCNDITYVGHGGRDTFGSILVCSLFAVLSGHKFLNS